MNSYDRTPKGHTYEHGMLRIETSAGHGAGKPTDMAIAERADVLAFLVKSLGMETP